MEINFRKMGNRDILEIEDARIVFRNFSGAPDDFTREGDRSFAVIIPDQDTADALIEEGWNVKIRAPRDENDEPFMFLKVKVNYGNGRGPGAYVQSGNSVTRLNEDTIGMLDQIDIASVDMDVRAYDWEKHGNSGRTAYLDNINVIQRIDRFGARYAEEGLI